MNSKKNEGCVFCHFARMRRDICGIYCVGKFAKEPDGTCKRFIHCHDRKAIKEYKAAQAKEAT